MVVTWENVLGEGISWHLKSTGNKTYKDYRFGQLLQSCTDVLQYHSEHLGNLQLNLRTRNFFVAALISCNGRMDTTQNL